MNDNTPDRIISRAEFRELTGISRTSEWDLLRRGKLPPIVIVNGRKLGYMASAVTAWMEANSVQVSA